MFAGKKKEKKFSSPEWRVQNFCASSEMMTQTGDVNQHFLCLPDANLATRLPERRGFGVRTTDAGAPACLSVFQRNNQVSIGVHHPRPHSPSGAAKREGDKHNVCTPRAPYIWQKQGPQRSGFLLLSQHTKLKVTFPVDLVVLCK